MKNEIAATIPSDHAVSISGIMAGVENHHCTKPENWMASAPKTESASRPPVSVQNKANNAANSPNTLRLQYHEKA